MTNHQVADIGQEPKGLSQNQNGVMAQHTINHYHARSYEADYPKGRRKRRYLFTAGINPLIDETESKNKLSRSAEYNQPHRYIFILQKVLNKMAAVLQCTDSCQ